MAYQKPSVTVKQTQKSNSLVYPDPQFQSCVVGPGYYWQDPAREDDEINAVYSGQYESAQIIMSGGDFTDEHGDNIIDDTVIVDLVRTKKDAASDGTIGEVKHLVKNTDFTVSGDSITVNADIPEFDGTEDKANIRVGFASERSDIIDNFERINEAQQIRDWVGEPVSWNPLAFGAEIMLTSSGAATNIIGTNPSNGDHGNAISILEMKKDIYTIAPLTQVAAENEKYLSHVVEMSKPENKGERIVFTNRKVSSYLGDPEPHSVSDKDAAAQAIQDYSASRGERRFFAIHPDGAFVRERRHVSTLRQSFIQAIFGNNFTLLPRFISSRKIGNQSYKSFQEIDGTVVDNLINNGIDYITVYAPVPGYYFNPAVAGQVVRKEPEQPLTNSGISSISRVYRSNDYFSERQLNTIAEGGTWIMQELSPDAIVNRHQLSTDALSIEARELSITNSVDFVAKYVRDLLSPVIGKRVISDSFLQEVRASLNGAAETLVNNGRVRSLNIIDVYQDDLQPDTLRVTLSVEPFFPVNNIKIELIF